MQSSRGDAGKCIFCLVRADIARQRRRPLQSIRSFSRTRPTSRDPTSGAQGYDFNDDDQHRSRDRLVRYSDGSRPDADFLPSRRRDLFRGSSNYRVWPGRTQGAGGNGRGGARGAMSFQPALDERIKIIEKELKEAPIAEQLEKEGSSFREVWRAFTRRVVGGRGPHTSARTTSRSTMPAQDLSQALRKVFAERGVSGLDERLKYAFYAHVTGLRFTESDIKNQKAMADLRYPSEWFPATRSIHRTIHLHVGPTNSGKTYHALQRLEQAETGVYAGPLRLLAHEIFSRLNAKGKRCTLITGEERRSPDDSLTSDMQSCTVEMMPMNRTIDVAVIDEIQMIGSADRGWAWTQALLGVKAREVHLCGEARTVPLIREICASLGEPLEVHEYERLSPLRMADESLNGDLRKLRKGDCIVAFSVMGIHALRRQIERQTKKKVATVYGSLPPETRAQQARLFNDPDNDYDYLVASDAIGMGLNLSIKRIIFESSTKFDGIARVPLAVAEVKQIGGRAGRYRTAHQATLASKAEQDLALAKSETKPDTQTGNEEAQDTANHIEAVASEAQESASDLIIPVDGADGASHDPLSLLQAVEEETGKVPGAGSSENIGTVTTLERFDFQHIFNSMRSEAEIIRTAGIFPPAPIVERFSAHFPPSTPFSFILLRLHELAQMHKRFHLCGLKDHLWIADLIEPVRNLTVTDRIILCACPAAKSDMDLHRFLLPALARCIEQQSGGNLLDIPEMPLEVLDEDMSADRDYLRSLERLHKGVVCYLWLSYRFAGIFTTRPLAFHVKELVEEKIEKVLSQFSFTEAQRRKIAASREQVMLKALRSEIENDSGSGGHFDQPSAVAGGGRFSGEEVLDILESPDEDQQACSGHDLKEDLSQRKWHEQEDSTGGSFIAQRPIEEDGDEDEASFDKVFAAEMMDHAAKNGHSAGQGRATHTQDLDTSAVRNGAAMSPDEPDAGHIIITEVGAEDSRLSTQSAVPTNLDAPDADENGAKSGPQSGPEIPKHLHLAGANATELERDASARP